MWRGVRLNCWFLSAFIHIKQRRARCALKCVDSLYYCYFIQHSRTCKRQLGICVNSSQISMHVLIKTDSNLAHLRLPVCKIQTVFKRAVTMSSAEDGCSCLLFVIIRQFQESREKGGRHKCKMTPGFIHHFDGRYIGSYTVVGVFNQSRAIHSDADFTRPLLTLTQCPQIKPPRWMCLVLQGTV